MKTNQDDAIACLSLLPCCCLCSLGMDVLFFAFGLSGCLCLVGFWRLRVLLSYQVHESAT